METLSSAMNVLTRAGIVILEFIFYHPAVSAILCCAALALFPVIFGAFWVLARRRFRCAKKYKTEEESK